MINIGDDMGTIHINANKEDIAPLVLLPGDPLRAKYIADKFLTDVKLVNDVRNMLAFTGYYKDKLITVMGSGMGCPSASLYAYELYKFYDVEKIIRIGTSGSMKESIKILDVVLSTGSYSESALAYHWGKYYDRFIETTYELNKIVVATAKEMGVNLQLGPTITSDTFDPYEPIDHIIDRCPFKEDLCASEMEGFGLCHMARVTGKQFTMLATVVDSKFTPEIHITSEEREQSLDLMITIALESIIK